MRITIKKKRGSSVANIQKRANTNHDTGLLGLLACAFMVVDHVGVVFFPRLIWMRVIGRIALPLFAWGIAIGATHTRNIGKYALRLLITMVISQPFFMLALNHGLSHLNIFATLLLGLIGIWGIKEKKEWMTILALLCTQSTFFTMDYGIRGVLCVMLLWAVHDKPLWLLICFPAYCVYWGRTSSAIWTIPFLPQALQPLRLQTTAVLALPLMLIPKQKRTRTPRLVMYSFYPVHLAILWGVKAAQLAWQRQEGWIVKIANWFGI